MTLIKFIEIMAILVGAFSGFIEARRKRMDLVGVFTVAFITAFGGGTMRDLLLARRDELGAPNWRGTVGLSTRGRDTGDAQFFINLIDNVRLDHEYTIFGSVTRGMDVVDALVEGAVIRRVRELRRD